MERRDEAELSMLMRAAIAGDEIAYGDFLQRAACLVRSFARRKIVQGGIDPEDIVQETLFAIHLKRHTWRQDGIDKLTRIGREWWSDGPGHVDAVAAAQVTMASVRS